MPITVCTTGKGSAGLNAGENVYYVAVRRGKIIVIGGDGDDG
jgi:hypothetical protein